MQINLTGWESSGLRCPDVKISLLADSGQPAEVSLIQMPNGTGKTTTLEMLRATLEGSATHWNPEKVREYRRPGATNDSGQFRVTLLVDYSPLTFELTLDFENGDAKYRTTTPGSGGVVGKWQPPRSMLNFLTPEFLNLFIFDGEFADRLLEQNAGHADKAIDALCQLYLLDEVAEVAEEQWKSHTRQGGPKTERGLAKCHLKQEELLKRKTDLVTAKKQAQKKIDENSSAIADLEKKIDERLNSNETTRNQHVDAKLALQSANEYVSRASSEVMALMRKPLALHSSFSAALVDLKENLDRLKLPENTSAQFFAELVEEPDCICGRPMNEVAKNEIIKRSQGYLDIKESGTINALKEAIDMFVSTSGDVSANDQLEGALNELAEARGKQRYAAQVLKNLTKKLSGAGDKQLETWVATLKTKLADREKCKELLQKINAPSEEETGGPITSIELVEKRLNEVRNEIAKITQTVELKEKTDLLESILNRTAELARERIRSELIEESNRRLENVLSNDPLRISRIDKSLHLANQTGASQTGASAGQNLSVGYTFLMSALSRGNNDFPLVVDSPANSIDEGVRRNIGTLIPQLCTQFVGFTINTERAGFVEALEKASRGSLFLTMFRKIGERGDSLKPCQPAE